MGASEYVCFISPLWKPVLFFWTRSLGLSPEGKRRRATITDLSCWPQQHIIYSGLGSQDYQLVLDHQLWGLCVSVLTPAGVSEWWTRQQASNQLAVIRTLKCHCFFHTSVLIPVSLYLPVTRGRVALFGLGLSGGRGPICVVARFLLPLDRLSTGFLPVSGSFWMNFFSTYFDRIHDSLSPLRDRKRHIGKRERTRAAIFSHKTRQCAKQKKPTCICQYVSGFAWSQLDLTSCLCSCETTTHNTCPWGTQSFNES